MTHQLAKIIAPPEYVGRVIHVPKEVFMGGNPYTGELERFDRAEDIPPTHAGPFRVGELLPWKGFWFEVTEIHPDRIVLASRGSRPQ